jgi:tetratricopeptide (TPR) repeat protein
MRTPIYTRSLFLGMCVFILCRFSVFAQLSGRDERRFDRAEKKYEALKFDEAENLLVPLSRKHPNSATIWNFLAQVQIRNYYLRSREDIIFGIARPDSSYPPGTPKRIRRDSLDRIFVKIMNDGRPSKRYFNRSVNTWREATLKCADAELPSMLLRTCILDPIPPDSSLNPAAQALFLLGEKALGKQNYADAINYYHRALQLDSLLFSARLGLGNAYYFNKEYVPAAHLFRETIRQKPLLQEPRKYLVDALYHMEEYDQAMQEAMDALIIYPEVSMFLKLQELAKRKHLNFDRHWMERVVFPNTVGDQPLNEKGDRDWMEYINGFSLVEKFCNKDGIIIQKNNLTKSNYAEVFSWEYMLKKTAPDKFSFARKMEQVGYLDCYVMLSEYHIDFNSQYQDFAKRNKERLKAYLEMLMNQ